MLLVSQLFNIHVLILLAYYTTNVNILNPYISLDPASSVHLSPSVSPLLAGELATFSCLAKNVSGPSVFRWFIGKTQLYDHTDKGGVEKNTWQSTLR